MLYIQETYSLRQLEFLRHFYKRGKYEYVVWLYPESKLKHLFGYELFVDSSLEGSPITKYDSTVSVKRTGRSLLSDSFLDEMEKYKRIYNGNCDSCVLYQIGESDWIASIVGHEGMCLVNDDSLVDELTSSGFSVSREKPAWW